MKLSKRDLWYGLLVGLSSFLLLFDLFTTDGHSAYMDGRAHLTTIAQFYDSLKQGVVPVRWTEGFANYGMPLPLFAHQTIGYLGGLMSLIFGGNIVLVYKLIFVLGGVISSILFYWFLRLYFRPLSSVAGVVLYNFAPYRIMNLYIREALPEFFASVFFPMILLGTYYFVKKKKKWAVPLMVVFFAIIALSHPMMLIVGGVLFGCYYLFLIKDEKKKLKPTLLYGLFLFWGVAVAAYYVIPLKLENKYFYYGQQNNHLTPGQYLSAENYLSPNWYYFYRDDIVNRGHFVKGGLPESIILVVGVVYLLARLRKKKFRFELVDLASVTGVFLVFMTTKYAGFLYERINLLSNIQFPWRMLSAYVYLPPIIVAHLVDQAKKEKWRLYLTMMIMLLVAVLRFPQAYSKNNTYHKLDRYFFTEINLHSVLMNTVWTGETADYPVKEVKGEIIEGEGELTIEEVKNGYRDYRLSASTPVRLADYTFYFPGWKVYVDGQEIPIEWQDPAFRGVITYRVPPGEHELALRFEETKVRKFSWYISGIATVTFIIWMVAISKSKKLAKIFFLE